jgi:hypothetical protein
MNFHIHLAGPADLEFAACRTSQLVFERVLFERVLFERVLFERVLFERVLFECGAEEVSTDGILHAIGQTRCALTPEVVAEFVQDIKDYARL